MHVVRVLSVATGGNDVLAIVMRKMLELQWDIEAQATLWCRAVSGSWWEKKVEVEVVVFLP